MTEEKKDSEEDRPRADFSLGGIFRGLGDFVELLGDLAEKGQALKKEGEFFVPGAKGKPLRGVYGFSIRTMGGRPIVESFGNVKKTPEGPKVQEVREPLVDVYDEGSEIVVLVELPGVEEKEIHWEVEGDLLRLEASGALRKYGKEILLPAQASSESARLTFNNGILELRLKKKEEEKKEED